MVERDDLVERLRECAKMELYNTYACGYLQEAADEIEMLRQWVNDCQAGMYINCVYCGHRYGPDDEVAATMQEALYEHIAECPKHPLSAAKAENERLREASRLYRHALIQDDDYQRNLVAEQADKLCGIK
jgi:hypothetical protein